MATETKPNGTPETVNTEVVAEAAAKAAAAVTSSASATTENGSEDADDPNEARFFRKMGEAIRKSVAEALAQANTPDEDDERPKRRKAAPKAPEPKAKSKSFLGSLTPWRQ